MDNTVEDQSVETAIRSFIAASLLYSEEGYVLADDASLIRERVIDSLGVVELAAFLARRFALRVEQSEVRPENFDSVTKLAAFVRRKRAAPSRDAVPAS